MPKLIHGDCMKHLPLLDDNSVDMVCVDLPYGLTRCKWDTPIDLKQMWQQLKRLVKPNGAMVFFSAQPFASKLISSNFPMFKQELIWEKNAATGFLNANKMHMSKHENICVFYRKLPTFNKQMTPGTPYKVKRNTPSSNIYSDCNVISTSNRSGYRNPTTVLKFPKPNQTKRFHPSQKPVKLLKYLIATYTDKGETVLDFTMGSGSTGVAALELNRQFIGIEKDQKFFDTARKRILG